MSACVLCVVGLYSLLDVSFSFGLAWLGNYLVRGRVAHSQLSKKSRTIVRITFVSYL